MINLQVIKTLVYADIFDYPLTKKEINKWLIVDSELSATCSVKKRSVLKVTASRPACAGRPDLEGLESVLGPENKTSHFYHLSNRSKIVALRKKRYLFSQLKLKKAKKIIKLLSFIPTIKLIALTGSLSMNNSDKNDDIDLMIVTKTNRLWLTRLLTILILEILKSRRRPKPGWFRTSKLHWFRTPASTLATSTNVEASSEPSILTKDKVCLNLFLDESALTIPKPQRNLYTAHEVCQIKPLYNKDQTYEKFLFLNSWVKDYLPNALPKSSKSNGSELSDVKKFGALCISKLNLIAFKFQYFYMKSKITNEKVSLHSAFFHPRPTGKIFLKKYKQKLRTVLGRRPGQRPSPNSEAERTDLNGTVILVTGCFDVLHQEHKKFLKAAKNYTVLNHQRSTALVKDASEHNILMVGLETDSRVKQLKGKDRPRNSLDIRIKNLKKWGIADKIFSLPEKFDSLKDYRALINQIKPDILAVSSHTPNLSTKRRLMKSIGGIVKVVHPHNPKFSTTKLLDKIS